MKTTRGLIFDREEAQWIARASYALLDAGREGSFRSIRTNSIHLLFALAKILSFGSFTEAGQEIFVKRGSSTPATVSKVTKILISAGFDAHRADPLAGLMWEVEDFIWLTNRICDVADKVCEGRIVSTLEGGYDLDALAASVAAHVLVLMERGG